MNHRANMLGVLLVAGVGLLLCAVPTQAQDAIPTCFVHPTFDSAIIDKLYVLRGVDLSIERKGHTRFDKYVSVLTRKGFKRKGYKFEFDGSSSVDSVTQENLSALSPEWIKTLGPAGARWVAMFVILDSAAGKTITAKAVCEMDIYVFDRVEGVVLYRSKDIIQVALGWMMTSGLAADEAMFGAINALVKKFPKRGEKPAPSSE